MTESRHAARVRRLAGLSPRQRSLLLHRLGDRRSSFEAIPARPPGQDRGPLSFSQQRQWFLDRMQPGSPTYNVPLAIRIVGPLDLGVLERAVNAIVARHEILRTRFLQEGDQPVQVIAPAMHLPLELVDLRRVDGPERDAAVRSLARTAARRPFDLTAAPLARLAVARLGAVEHVFVLVTHHIVADGWSLGVFFRELATHYAAMQQGRQSPLAPLAVQFLDVAMWQRARAAGGEFDADLAWWARRLVGAPGPLTLAGARPRPPTEAFTGALRPVALSPPVSAALAKLARQAGATPFMVLFAILAVLLSRESGSVDLVIGTPVANRRRPEIEPLIGYFLNSLALRVDLSGSPRFIDLLTHVRRVAADAFEHQDAPFEKVVEAVNPERTLAHQPIFQAMFTFHNEPTRRHLSFPGVRWEELSTDRGAANRDLTLRLGSTDAGFAGHVEYSTALFDEAAALRLVGRWEALAAAVAADPTTRVDRLGTRTAAERTEEAQSAVARAAERRRRFEAAITRAPARIATLGEAVREADDGAPPLVLTPSAPDVDLAAWVREAHAHVQALLARHGAVLWRGFGVATTAELQRIVAAFGSTPMDYQERSTPRTVVDDRVYTSTEYPADQSIMLHSELAYAHCWPTRLWFHCVRPASEGGATPIADTRAVLAALDPAVRDAFARRGVLYLRNYGTGVDLSWREAFQTQDREAVEAYCAAAGLSVEWRPGERLRTRRVGSALVRHAARAELVWFNSAHMFHVAGHVPAVRDALRALHGEADLPRHAFFADGGTIPDAMIEHIRAVFAGCARPVRWQAQDVLLVDNVRLAHGREPFKGPRTIHVVLTDAESTAAAGARG